jgi:thioredoxin 1
MSEADSDDERIEEIRQQKKAELREKLESGTLEEDDGEDAGQAAPDAPIHVESAEHFQEVIGQYDTVLVDFYADWCGPCKQLEPIVEQLAAETEAAVAKVDIDALQRLAQQHQVRGVPTLILFSGGQVAERVVGVRGKDHFERLIAQYA